MTIDEKLEALTHSVELLAAMHKDNEERFATLADLVIKHEKESNRFQRSMRAALVEWTENSTDEGEAT